MLLSVIIVKFNTRELLRHCLHSLEAELRELDGPCQVLLVDNASSDGSQAMVQEQFPWVHLIANSDNVGFPRANNQVLDNCQGEFLLFLNPDTVVEPGSLRQMLEFLEHHPGYGAVGPKITRPDGSIQLECASNFPDLWHMFCELTRLSRLFSGSPLFGRWRMTFWDHQDSQDVNCLLGAAILMRRDILRRIGPLDEHMYIEDVDLCYRILQDGWKIRYLATAGIVHHDGASRKGSMHFYRHYQIAWTGLWHFFVKHHSPFQALVFRSMSGLFSAAGLLLFVVGLLFALLAGKSTDSYRDKLLKSWAVLVWSLTPANAFRSGY